MVDFFMLSRKLFIFLVVFVFFFFWETQLEILICIEFIVPITFFSYCIIKHSRLLPKVVIATSLFSIAVDIGLTKVFLSSSDTFINLPLVTFFTNQIVHKNWIIGVIYSICILVLDYSVIKKSYRYVSVIYRKSNIKIISQIVDSLSFLYAASVFVIYLSIANVIAGILFNILQTDLELFEIIKIVLPYISINIFLFTVPQIFIALNCDIYCYLIKPKE